MKISITLPAWDWVTRLLERKYPGLQERAEAFGRASTNARYLGGAVDITATVETRPQ